MFSASTHSGITAEVQAAIESAAERVGAKVADMRGYFLAGDRWEVETPDELSDLLVQCWEDQEQQGLRDQ
jgi:hypothetical protein